MRKLLLTINMQNEFTRLYCDKLMLSRYVHMSYVDRANATFVHGELLAFDLGFALYGSL